MRGRPPKPICSHAHRWRPKRCECISSDLNDRTMVLCSDRRKHRQSNAPQSHLPNTTAKSLHEDSALALLWRSAPAPPQTSIYLGELRPLRCCFFLWSQSRARNCRKHANRKQYTAEQSQKMVSEKSPGDLAGHITIYSFVTKNKQQVIRRDDGQHRKLWW